MARPPKVGGIRTAVVGGEATEPQTPDLPDIKKGIYQFRAAKAAYRLSVRRRRIERGPEGETMEVSPRTADEYDAPLDMVRFEDHYFETPSKELADAVIEKAKKLQVWGVGLEIWSVEDETKAIDLARENELRRMLAERPDIAKRVLQPSAAEDFALPAPPAA